MNSLYVIREGKPMVRLTPEAYARESDFQQLLEDFPDLLPGDQIDGADPRRWLFVAREAAVPGDMDGADRWSLDHLFLDQDAVPTLVEVKRQSDTRLRREVVGQMLDYAANAVAYWPGDRMREQWRKTCQAKGLDEAEVLTGFLGDGGDPEAFWAAASANLRTGRVRLVFVADRIPPELQRIVEFLNERMSPTEVLAVEIRRYTGDGMSTHIPRVIGQTSAARLLKPAGAGSPGARKKWD